MAVAVPLILASASPRRQQLLREAGYAFTVDPADIDEETAGRSLLPIELALHLATLKARAVAPRHPDAVTLAADTVVALGDRSLGKPATPDEARRMLELLEGTTHIVITGVCVACPGRGVELARRVMSAVRMRRLGRKDIDRYVATRQWEGKAGGYGIQDDDPFVTNMAGSLTNIVGLPMEATCAMLGEAGVKA